MTFIKACQQQGVQALPGLPLAPYSYMKVGGPADYSIVASSTSELITAINLATEFQLPYLVIGAASNLLFDDQGFRGVIIRNRTNEIKTLSDSRLEVDSGVVVNHLVNHSIAQQLQGLEEFLGIPGTVGGAVFNNSHHLQHLIGDYISSVTSLGPDIQTHTLSQAECQFAYDHSVFQSNGHVILSAIFSLSQVQDSSDIQRKALAALKRRRDTQPLEYPSTGCMFKNIGQEAAHTYGLDPFKTSAGYLIDQAGLKGMSVGGAMVSPKHANFIINTGNATSENIRQLVTQISEVIQKRYGITLEREVFFV